MACNARQWHAMLGNSAQCNEVQCRAVATPHGTAARWCCSQVDVPPVEQKRGMPSPSSVASIEHDAVTSTPLLTNVIISNTTGWLLSNFFWNLVALLLSDRCCLCLHFCLLMLLPLALTTTGWLLLKYFFGMWWHCHLHAHWLFLLPLSLLF